MDLFTMVVDRTLRKRVMTSVLDRVVASPAKLSSRTGATFRQNMSSTR